MFLRSLKVLNFRNLAHLVLAFDPGVNVLLGSNAQGKTSLLEAILFLATCTSHRTFREQELIRTGAATAYVGGEVVLPQGEITRLEVGFGAEGKQVKVDGAPLPRLGQLYGRLRVALMAPEDLEIVAGGPRLRRKFLDLAIAQCDPPHIERLQEYNRALRQRNAFLRRSDPFALDEAELRGWDEQLISTAVPPVLARRALAAALALEASERYRALAGSETLTLRYLPDLGPEALEPDSDVAALCRRVLLAARSRDVARGQTGRGPHRDDFALEVAARPLRVYGSQGQRRTASLALRLAEAAVIARRTGQAPLLLIDDVIYEMDAGRRARFLDMIDRGAQVFVTATQLDPLGPLAERAKIFRVDGGSIAPLN